MNENRPVDFSALNEKLCRVYEIVSKDSELAAGPYFISGAVEVEQGFYIDADGGLGVSALWSSRPYVEGLDIYLGKPDVDRFDIRPLPGLPPVGHLRSVETGPLVNGVPFQLSVAANDLNFDVLLAEVDVESSTVVAASQCIALAWDRRVVDIRSFARGSLSMG